MPTPSTQQDAATPGVDPNALARIYVDTAERAARVLSAFAQKQSDAGGLRDELGLAQAYLDWYAHLLKDPYAMAAASINLTMDTLRLWQSTWMRLFGLTAPEIAEPAKGDQRFKDAQWQDDFLFDFIKQSYLITARHVQSAVAEVHDLPENSRKKVTFFTRQFIDALSPTNFAMTNPQVLRETLSSQGQNLIKGLNNLLDDIEQGQGQLRIRMTDMNAFALGKNVATTPGKVVFQNELMQLIQYTPRTAQVQRRPLVIIPPWINKYYILDLRAKNSFIQWALDQGHTVFVISWVNPDAQLADKGFEDYMQQGPLAALDAVERATGERTVNFIGYCLGGTLLGCTLAWLAARGEDRVGSATFFVSLLDFSEPGELGVFIDEAQVARLEERMHGRLRLAGSAPRLWRCTRRRAATQPGACGRAAGVDRPERGHLDRACAGNSPPLLQPPGRRDAGGLRAAAPPRLQRPGAAAATTSGCCPGRVRQRAFQHRGESRGRCVERGRRSTAW
jgi:polyhydroxyalkanoate synthase